MAWKVRKEKSQTEAAETEPNDPVAAFPEETVEAHPVFDLSGDAFRTVPEKPAADEASPETEDDLLAFPTMAAMHEEDTIPRATPFIVDVPPEIARIAPEAPPHLVVHLGKLAATFSLEKEITVIGRPDPESSTAPDVEIELDDAVSRRHAEIHRHDDDFYLVDLNSTNGTRLNGETLIPNEERRLLRGDRIQIGERTEISVE